MPYLFLKRRREPIRRILGPAIGIILGLMPLMASATVSERLLANGLKVIVKEDHRAPVAVAQVWYRAGSMDESYGTTGVAHLLEHMMFKGTPKVPAGEFSKRIAALGGRENAFTSRDHTAYFQTLQAARLEQAMVLESDRMAHLTLAPEAFAKEIEVVKEERRLRTDDNPQSRLYEQLMAVAYAEHPYRHPVIGWMNDLENMTVTDARHWYERWYAPNNATLVVAGDVRPEQVFAWAEQYYGVIPRRNIPLRKAFTEPEPQGGRQVVVRAPAKLPVAILAWPVPRLQKPATDVDPYALEILVGVLDGHGSARLPQALVKTQRVAVDVDTGYDPVSRGPAQFVISLTPAEGRPLSEAVEALKRELQRLAKEGVSETELARAKAQVVAGQVFQQDSLFYQAMQIGEWETAGLSWRDRSLRFERLRAVTAEQVRAVAEKYLRDTRMTFAELEPLPMPLALPEGRPMPASGGARVH